MTILCEMCTSLSIFVCTVLAIIYGFILPYYIYALTYAIDVNTACTRKPLRMYILYIIVNN